MSGDDSSFPGASNLLNFKREHADGRFSYILLPRTRLEDAVELLTTGFYPFENVSICTRVPENPRAVTELNDLARECIADGASIVAIDKATDRIVGISINKIQKKSTDPGQPSFFEKFVETRCKEKESISLIELMTECDSYVNVFERYNTTKVMEVMYLTVLPDYRKNNIGSELVRSSLSLADQLCARFNGPDLVVSLFASEYSRRIGQKLRFETVKVVPYEHFQYEGVKYSDTLPPEHTGVHIMVKECERRASAQKRPDEAEIIAKPVH